MSETIRLLIINDQQSEVERLLSMLRNAGKNTRAQHVPSMEGLEKLLADSAWDLMIGLDGSQSCDPKEAVRTIKKLDKDIPVVIQADVEDDAERSIALIEGLKAGARDVVVLDDDQHLLIVMDRELKNLEERRQRRAIDRKYNTSERRCQQLLDSSRDAIAYVEDGMFLYLNQSFGELFGYEDPDDALAIPMIDMVTDGNQDAYVQFMKEFKLSDSAGSQDLSVKAVKEDGTEFDVTLSVSHANYDEEACVQLLVEGVGSAAAPVAAAGSADASSPAAAAPAASSNDPITGLYNRRYMFDALGKAVIDAAENDRYRSLYYISIDRFDQIRNEIGLTNTDAMLAGLGSCLKENVEESALLARLGDDEFLLLAPGMDAEQHLTKANDLCKKVEEQIIQAGNKSLQLTVSVGIAPITESATNPDDILKRAHQAGDEARAAGNDGVGNGAKVYIPTVAEGDSDDASVLEVIRHNLQKESFKLLFQPIISLQGVEEEHYEVLIQLAGDEGSDIDTGTLFRAVESDNALAIKLDRWVILQATKMLAEHRSKGHNTRLILNLTASSLQDTSLAEWLAVAFKAGGVPSEAVIFQFSENDATNYLNQAKAFTDATKALGCSNSIKHFGCALDPFKALGHLSNVSIVKVDGSFSTDIQKNNEDPAALKELISQLGEAGKQTIIPFVENATMMATLWQAGAHFIQGHYLQAPSNSMDFEFDDEE